MSNETHEFEQLIGSEFQQLINQEIAVMEQFQNESVERVKAFHRARCKNSGSQLERCEEAFVLFYASAFRDQVKEKRLG